MLQNFRHFVKCLRQFILAALPSAPNHPMTDSVQVRAAEINIMFSEGKVMIGLITVLRFVLLGRWGGVQTFVDTLPLYCPNGRSL